MPFRAPVDDLLFTLRTIAGLDEAIADGLFPELTPDLVDQLVTEAGRFVAETLAPLNVVGDQTPATLKDGAVTTPPGWREAYAAYVEAGWNALVGDPAFGGQGLPTALNLVLTDLLNQANPGFALAPLLTASALLALEAHGSAALKALYLPNLISGRWTGTMNLTEPHAGSDLSTLRTRAEPQADGSYRLFGQKIYITYGEHDLTENIIHFVLARLPDAPAGTRGISLFLVPKFVVAADGTPGPRNDVWCRGLEHKLGINASPTCTMIYGEHEGATGWLVGEPNKGLKCMFTMMNSARLAVGMQGAAIADRAFRHALDHARARRQGRAPDWHEPGMAPIVHHPDVKRMLLEMRGLAEAARAICYTTAVVIDRAAHDAPDRRAFWQARADLLTPVAKAFSSDIGVEVASAGIQVHGGMGFIEETGAAQFYRDARIFPIYEGSNGIQAIDLVTRKLPEGGGEPVRAYLADLREISETARGANDAALGTAVDRLAEAIDAVEAATAQLIAWQADGQVASALAGASRYLRAFGLTAGGAYLVKGALAARNGSTAGAPKESRRALARFYADHCLSEVPGRCRAVIEGADSIVAASPDLLLAE